MKENESPPSDCKLSRIIGAVERVHQIRIQSSEEAGGYQIFARTLGDGTGGTGDQLQQHLQAVSTYPGQNIHNYEPRHGILTSIPRESCPLRAAPPNDQGSTYEEELPVLADRAVDADQGWAIHEDEPFAHRRWPLQALVVENHGVDTAAQEWSSDEDEGRARRHQHLQASMQENRGRRLAVMGQNGLGIQFHRISPIPFNVHKVPCPETPSVYSDSTRSEGDSPSFPYSCKAAVKEAYTKFVLTSTEGSVKGGLNLSKEPQPNTIEQWLNHTNPSPSSGKEEIAEHFEIWQDVDRSFHKSGTALSGSALNDVTNFRHPEYLQFDNPARNSAVAAYMRNNIDAKRVASLRGAKKLPSGNPSRPKNAAEMPEIRQVQGIITAVQFADVHGALPSFAMLEPPYPPSSRASPATSSEESCGDAPCPPKWPASRATSSTGELSEDVPGPPNSPASLASHSNAEWSQDDDDVRVPSYNGPLLGLEACLTKPRSPAAVAINQATAAAEGNAPLEHGSERAAKRAFALARLEGRVLPQPSSPIRRFVDSTGLYGDDVEEEFRTYFGQPQPRRWINPKALLERFHGAAESGLFEEGSNINSSRHQPNTFSGELRSDRIARHDGTSVDHTRNQAT